VQPRIETNYKTGQSIQSGLTYLDRCYLLRLRLSKSPKVPKLASWASFLR
jgi:hypothetical protein